MPDYVSFEAPMFGHEEHGQPYELRIGRNGDSASFLFGHGDAQDLLFQIQRAIDVAIPLMEWEDLGLTNPDDLPF